MRGNLVLVLVSFSLEYHFSLRRCLDLLLVSDITFLSMLGNACFTSLDPATEEWNNFLNDFALTLGVTMCSFRVAISTVTLFIKGKRGTNSFSLH